MTLSADLIGAKNTIEGDHAWLLFLEVTFTDLRKLFLVRNTEDITWNGQLYTAAAFSIDITRQTTQGELQRLQLSVSNVTRVIQAYLEELNGAVGSTVKITVVNSELLTEDYSELEIEFSVISATCNAYHAAFTLGAPSPLIRRFPRFRYISRHCNWKFREAECGYAGVDLTCSRTLAACRAKSNSARFGGYPGLDSGGIRFV